MASRRHWQRLPLMIPLLLSGCEAGRDPLAPVRPEAQTLESPEEVEPAAPLAHALQSFPVGSSCLASSWCWMSPRVTGAQLGSIAGTSSRDLWIGGEADTLLHWDGSEIRQIPTSIRDVRQIHALAPDDVWVASIGGVIHWDGARFTPTGVTSASSIWAADARTVYAAAMLGGLSRWNGTAWERVREVTEAQVVAGSGPSDVWAGGRDGMWHFDGARWTQPEQLRHLWFERLEVLGPRNVWAVGIRQGVHYVCHFDGDRWTIPLDFPTLDYSITGFAGTGPDDVWLVGGTRNPVTRSGFLGFVLHYDGGRFTQAPLGPTYLRGAGTVGGTSYAVGESGSIFVLERTPMPEARSITAPTPRLRAVWGSSPSDVWAVGVAGTALHFDGTMLRSISTGTDVTLTAVGGSGGSGVWAAGERGTLLHWTPHTGFHAVESGVTANLTSVFAASPDEVWVGGAGVMLRVSRAGVERVALAGQREESILDIHGTAADDVWATSFTGVYHFDGKVWSGLQTLSVQPRRVWALAPDDVWVTSNSRFRGLVGYAHWDGTGWTTLGAAPSTTTWMFPWDFLDTYVDDSWSFGPGDVWAVTPGGYLVRKQSVRP